MTQAGIPRSPQSAMQLIQNLATMRAEFFRDLLKPQRDVAKECRYPDKLDERDYKKAFDRQGIATRIVDVYPEESWKDDPLIYQSEEGEESAFDKAWDELDKQHNLLGCMLNADTLSGIGHYGVLLLGFDDVSEERGETLAKPVPGVKEAPDQAKPTSDGNGKPVKPATASPTLQRKLLYVMPFDQTNVEVKEWETRKSSPRFAKPKVYKITFTELAEGQTGIPVDQKSQDVHWTRVIHLADNRLTSQVLGTPRLQHTYNYAYNCDKILGAGGEGFWRNSFPGLSIESQGDVEGVEFDLEAIRKQVGDYFEGFDRMLGLLGMTAKTLAPTITDPTNHLEVQIDAICITIGCPKRIFKGSERGELASTQDQKAWNERIKKRRGRYLTPYVIRPLIDRLMEAGVLPTVDTYEIAWPDANTPTQEERANTAAKQAEALAKYVSNDIASIIPPLEWLVEFMGLDQALAEAILQAATEAIEATVDVDDPEAHLGRRSTMESDAEKQQRERKEPEEMPFGAG